MPWLSDQGCTRALLAWEHVGVGLRGGVGALELSTEDWGSELRGGDMGEEAGGERNGGGARKGRGG